MPTRRAYAPGATDATRAGRAARSRRERVAARSRRRGAQPGAQPELLNTSPSGRMRRTRAISRIWTVRVGPRRAGLSLATPREVAPICSRTRFPRPRPTSTTGGRIPQKAGRRGTSPTGNERQRAPTNGVRRQAASDDRRRATTGNRGPQPGRATGARNRGAQPGRATGASNRGQLARLATGRATGARNRGQLARPVTGCATGRATGEWPIRWPGPLLPEARACALLWRTSPRWRSSPAGPGPWR
jgi:hypothetical protein